MNADSKWYRLMGEPEEKALGDNMRSMGLDTTVPNVARMYDYFLGGKNNFEVDRQAAAEIAKLMPASVAACRQNRAFLGRVVRNLAEAGITQFIDIGSGLPTAQNTHEIVQAVDPKSRVVYVDNDLIAVTHARALLEKGSRGVFTLQADVREPGDITGSPEVRELIDFSQPVAVLLLAVLHFVTDGEQPYDIVHSLMDAMPRGSALAISHITDEEVSAEQSLGAQKIYQGASAPAVPRSGKEIARFFDGLEMAEPGVVDINHWPTGSIAPPTPLIFYGGVALK